MTIGQRLRRAMARAKLTQKDVANLTGLEQATVSDIVNDRSHPKFRTVEQMVIAIGTTFGELFDEPRIQLSYDDAVLARRFSELLHRLLENDAAQKSITETVATQSHSTRRRGDASTPETQSTTTKIRDARILTASHEVQNLPTETIPEPYFRAGARRAFRVLTDSMIGSGILQNALVYVIPTLDIDAADGRVIVCKLMALSI
jgi:transcriptional regulator with XRE-family HTH domain